MADENKRYEPLTDESPFPFGPTHKGKKLKDVPSSYLWWLSGRPWLKDWPALNDYIKRNMTAIKTDLPDQN